VRPYKVPTFEEIFEKDHSATTEAAQQVVLNLRPGNAGSEAHTNNLMTFSNNLSENNRNSQIEPPSRNQHMYEDIFSSGQVTSQVTSTTLSYEDIMKQKLVERAKQELLKKQRMKSQRIKNQQKQEKFLKMNKFLQQHKKKTAEKSPRSQQLDNFFSKIQGFGSSKTSQFKPDLIKKYQAAAGLIKKSDQEEQSSPSWAQKAPDSFSKINGQQYLDKSWETKILDSDTADRQEQIASHRAPVPSSRHDVVTTERTTTTTTTPRPRPQPTRRVWLDVDETENETENMLSEVAGKRKEPSMFTEEMCDKLRVPCRFVTEHPCCSLPQDIDMMGRPRAMDGSADLKWRYYQSRGGRRGGTRPGSSTRGSGEARMLSGFQAGYNNKIPYNSWKSPTDIRVPRYFYDGGPDLTSTILSQCWRLTYLNCRRDRQHPCCELRDRSDHQANNLLDKWLRRY